MTNTDEKELHRLSDMLQAIDRTLDASSPLREALQKAGIALHLGFIRGLRPDIDRQFEQIAAELSDPQRARLRNIGIDPEST